jgi:mono/diheme cytochrome c family protein
MKPEIRLLIAAALCSIAACGGKAPTREWTPADHGQPQAAPDGDRAEPVEDDGEDPTVRAARALWNATCAGCHGRDARGHGEAAPPIAKIPDFTLPEFQKSCSDEQLAQVIRDGRGMMPGFGKQVNPQGIAALVHHIRSVAVPPSGAAQGAAPAAPSAAPAPAPAPAAPTAPN